MNLILFFNQNHRLLLPQPPLSTTIYHQRPPTTMKLLVAIVFIAQTANFLPSLFGNALDATEGNRGRRGEHLRRPLTTRRKKEANEVRDKIGMQTFRIVVDDGVKRYEETGATNIVSSPIKTVSCLLFFTPKFTVNIVVVSLIWPITQIVLSLNTNNKIFWFSLFIDNQTLIGISWYP